MAHWKEVYYKHYKVSRNGTVVRIKPGVGTYVGRVLTPYSPEGSDVQYVRLYAGDRCRQYRLDDLVNRAFGKGTWKKRR